MRDLKRTDKNVMTIFDVASGTKIHLFYRTVTAEDRIKFNSAVVNLAMKEQDPKAIIEMQIQWGKKLCTGFQKGDLGIDDKPISTDPEDKDYYEGWLGLLEDEGSDLLATLCKTLLGEPNYVVKDDFFSIPKLKNTSGNARKKKRQSA